MIKLIKLYSTVCKMCDVFDQTTRKQLQERNKDTNIEFEAINTDKNTELAEKLNIGSVPQLILQNDSNFIKYKGDMHNVEAIIQWIIINLS